MTGNKSSRASVVYSAAVALREYFQRLNVRWAIYGDLACHLLCGSVTGGFCQLDVQVMGDSSTLAYVTQGLASVDHRFSLNSLDADSKATMSYIHDVLNDGSPMEKRQCQVRFVSGHLDDFFIVKDLPLLPIQMILHRYMQTYRSSSEKKLKKFISGVITISKAYLCLPNLPPPVWSLTLAERPLFLNQLAKISAAFPESAELLTRLHPGPSPGTTISPDPPSVMPDLTSGLTEVVDISLLSVEEKKEPGHSNIVLAATSLLSSSIHQLGHDCFLAGPGYAPWYIMGSPTVPTDYRIDFLVILHNNSLDSLQRILCQQGILEAKHGAYWCSVLARDGKSRIFMVTLEEVPSSIGLRPGESIERDFNGIPIINQSYLFSTMLTSARSRGLPMETKTYKNVVAAAKLLSQHNVDVRAAFEDVAELDQLACTYVKSHPALRPYFTAVGFDSVLPPVHLPEVDVQTVCGPTPTVRIPAIGDKGGIVFQAALDATRVLRDSGYSCAIFGSTACYLYGNERRPKDVDMLVSSSADAEVVKARMVKRLPVHFSLVKAETPGATYKILWYRHHQNIGGRIVSRQTKVDIVMAGAMMLPFLSSRSTIMKESLPVVPLEVLLLHKLQGWHDHMTAPEPHKQRKQTADVVDIRRILKIVLQSLTGTERSWARVALSFFQEEFQHLTMDRVKLFCSAFPGCRDDWYQLGFEVA